MKALQGACMRTSTNARERHYEELLSDLDNQVWNDAKNRWWVSELLAKDCDEAWIHTGWEDTMQKWYEWLEHMKKKDEKEKWRRCISERWRR